MDHETRCAQLVRAKERTAKSPQGTKSKQSCQRESVTCHFQRQKLSCAVRKYSSPPTVRATLLSLEHPSRYFCPSPLHLQISQSLQGSGDPSPTAESLGCSPPSQSRALSGQRSPRYPRTHGNIRASMNDSRRTEARRGRWESRCSLSIGIANGGLPLR